MYDSLGLTGLTAPQAAVWFGLILGLAFGALAEATRFCFRRALVGAPGERRPAAGVWLTALAVALVGTQAAVAAGWIGFDAHRLTGAALPLGPILAGGLMFGAGMVLTRGCASRLTVLAASGNLRALGVLLVFAVAAHATMKGVLVPLRTALGGWTLEVGTAGTLGALPGGPLVWAALIAAALLTLALRSGARPLHLGLAALLGLLVPAGWVGTGFVLFDDFDPIAMESLSFTAPFADTLFWGIAATAIPAGFGVGLIGGAFAGAGALALLSGRFAWQSFESPRQTGRYLAGGAIMGVGGVLAGGCTIGAGLAGIPTLGLAALLVLAAIAAGALATDRALARGGRAAAVAAE